MQNLAANTRSLFLLLLCLAFSSPALGAPRSVVAPSPAGSTPHRETLGIYPVELPDGLTGFADKLAAQLRDGALGLPKISAVQKLTRGACLFDEPGCLAEVAKSAQVSRLVSGKVRVAPQGYGFELRLIDARDGRELGTQTGGVVGGPLDLAGGLEHGLCELMGGDPCTGTVHVQGDGSDGVHVSIDGADRGALPLPALALPVGRHLIRVADQEKRVRIAYLRETQLACAGSGSQLTLTDLGTDLIQGVASDPMAPINPGAPTVAAPQSALPSSTPTNYASASSAKMDPRTRAGRVLLALGGALLMTSAGLEIYARAESNTLERRYQTGQLTPADEASYGKVHTAGVAALLVAATGVGAVVTGGILFLISPTGAGVGGKF
jgi:hypothetical protein